MGIYASYYAIDDNQVKEFKALLSKDNDDNVERFFESLEEFNKNEEYLEEHYICLYNSWGGLHFLLMGLNDYDEHNANKTPEQLALYYGIFGQETLDDEGIYLLNSDKVLDVVNALNTINIDELLDKADFDEFRKSNFYPDVWYYKDRDEFRVDLLKTVLYYLKQFYQNVLKNNRSVLIAIC